jgi:cell volume regulation protein A
MILSVAESLIVGGLIIILGFLGVQVFESTKIIEIPLLLLIGFLIGPILHLVNPATLSSLAGYFGALALLVILFDSGLKTKIETIAGSAGKTLVETFSIFVVTLLLLTVLLHYVFGYSIGQAALFSAIVDGTSAAVILVVIPKLNTNEDVKTVLSMESIITSPLQIIIVISIIGIMTSSSVGINSTVNSLLGEFSIAFVIALIVGVIWLKILKNISKKPFAYMLTLAVALMLYGFNEMISASGAIAVLVFALIIGNGADIWKALKMGGEFKTPENFKDFQTEITFFVKTFFFVYLGILIQPQFFNATSIIIALSITAIIIASRVITLKFFVMKIYKNLQGSLELMSGMMPRGLTEAVLVVLPASSGIQIPYLLEIAFLIIIFTNIITTIEILRSEKKAVRKPKIVK